MAEVGLNSGRAHCGALCVVHAFYREGMAQPPASPVGTPLAVLGAEPGTSEHLMMFAALG